jgi:microcystin-dependent protein
MAPASIGTGGASQPHANMMPYLAVGFCIALQGIFSSRN